MSIYRAYSSIIRSSVTKNDYSPLFDMKNVVLKNIKPLVESFHEIQIPTGLRDTTLQIQLPHMKQLLQSFENSQMHNVNFASTLEFRIPHSKQEIIYETN